jgi:hypothetical protein
MTKNPGGTATFTARRDAAFLFEEGHRDIELET